jgi:hypothetical protein
MRQTILALMVLGLMPTAGLAGGWRHGRVVVGGANGPAMTGVPVWAAERMRNLPGPFYVPQAGRRPWAYALSQGDNTPSARMARAAQLGGGVGPTPGASNGPSFGYMMPYAGWGPNWGY